MLATIMEMEPSILQKQCSDGTVFRASDSYVRAWMHDALRYSRRKGTRAAHKLPVDWEDQVEQSFLRKAYIVKEYDVLPELFVNSDQTQGIYAPGDKLTWAETGAKQIDLAGNEEKRAFTILISISNDGTLLPFQAIYHGLTSKSCPSTTAPCYDEAIAAGFRFEFSGTKTYWSNQKTMREFVDNILAPYFENSKKKLNRPPEQRCIWQMDVWSVHRSLEFREWMKANHPTIILDYVPGGCTGVAQPCDVGFQRGFKLSLKRSYHEDLVQEILDQKKAGAKIITLDTRLPLLRDRSVRWLWNAYKVLNKKAFIQKVRRTFKDTWSHPSYRLSRLVVFENGTCLGNLSQVMQLAKSFVISLETILHSFER